MTTNSTSGIAPIEVTPRIHKSTLYLQDGTLKHLSLRLAVPFASALQADPAKLHRILRISGNQINNLLELYFDADNIERNGNSKLNHTEYIRKAAHERGYAHTSIRHAEDSRLRHDDYIRVSAHTLRDLHPVYETIVNQFGFIPPRTATSITNGENVHGKYMEARAAGTLDAKFGVSSR